MKTISEEKYEFTLPNKMTLIFHDKETAEWLQGLIDGNDEAVRLLRKARKMWVDDDSITAEEIDAYLAKRNES